jgi:hypothetical protein
MSLTKLSLAVLFKLLPARENLVSDIPAGDVKLANHFLQYIPSFLDMFLPGNCSTLTLFFLVSDPVFVIMEYVAKGKLQELLRKSRAEQYYGNLHGTTKKTYFEFLFFYTKIRA